MTIGSTEATYTATTGDIDPVAFTFGSQGDVAFWVSTESASVVISGLSVAAPISISNGEYAIAGGDYTAAAGSISEGPAVKVRLNAPSDFDMSTTATLSIGSVQGAFVLTTPMFDITPPR